MKLSKRFKFGVIAWIVLLIYFISDNLWVELISFELFLVFMIYDGVLTKKSKTYQLVRAVTMIILGLISIILFLQKIHNDSIKSFNQSYEDNNTVIENRKVFPRGI